MRIVIQESATLRRVVDDLFLEHDPDFPRPVSTTPSVDVVTLSNHTVLSVPVNRELVRIIKLVVDTLSGVKVKVDDHAAILLGAIIADDHLTAVLLSGWTGINVIDNRGTFSLTYHH